MKIAITPWLSVRASARAVEFYKEALGAVEVYGLVDPYGHHWEIGRELDATRP